VIVALLAMRVVPQEMPKSVACKFLHGFGFLSDRVIRSVLILLSMLIFLGCNTQVYAGFCKRYSARRDSVGADECLSGSAV